MSQRPQLKPKPICFAGIWRRCWSCCETRPSGASRVPPPKRRIKAHRHLGDLADYFNLIGEAVGLRFIQRCGMWLHDHISVAKPPPAAHVALAMLEKIDRPFELGIPARVHDPPLGIVNDDERPWGNDRKH